MDEHKKIGAVAVIGSGIAGMQASLDLANSGFKVYLIEKKSAIGGRMPQLDKTFPTDECAMCVVSPKIVECGRHINIELMTTSVVERIEGEPGAFTLTLKRQARFVDMQKCTACTECERVCPVEIPSIFDRGVGNQHAIYRLYPQAVPSSYAIVKAAQRSPCRIFCPAQINAHGYIALASKGKYHEAYELIRDASAFGGVLSRICYHPCEHKCNRKELDEPLAINPIKRFVVDFVYEQRTSRFFETQKELNEGSGSFLPYSTPHPEERRDEGSQEIPQPFGLRDEPSAINTEKNSPRAQLNIPYSFGSKCTEELLKKRQGKKIAIIGSGPAGLSCAYDLLRLGYEVCVFERERNLGGMLELGIPSYRLPRSILQKELALLLDMGLKVEVGCELGKDKTLSQLRDEGFAAVFIATGTGLSRRLAVEGEDLAGVYFGLDFLKKDNSGERLGLGEAVVVIGGGNVAIDCARCCVRLGAKKVCVVCLESEEEMPAHPWEVNLAKEEGIEIINGFGPKRILGESGKVKGVEFKRCVKVFDGKGRFRPEFDESTIKSLKCSSLIIAIGQFADPSFLKKSDGIKVEHGLIKVDEITLMTGREGIFAGGDCVSGPKSATEAMGMGKEAATSIDRYILGMDLKEGRKKEEEGAPLPSEADLTKKRRVSVKKREASERIKDFAEVEQTLLEEELLKEAGRCLNCSFCCECFECERVCEPKAIVYNMADDTLKISVGAVVVATGVGLFDANKKKEYGFDRYDNVITSLQLERLLSSSGPTKGEFLKPSDGKIPKAVAFIQCVGSRDPSCGNEFCSSVCCMYTAKQARIIREHFPEVRIKIFFIDVRAFGKGFERYYERVKEEGIVYKKCMIAKVYETPTKNLKLRYIDEADRMMEEEFELVVLSVGLTEPADFKEVKEILGLEANSYGFCQTKRLYPGLTNQEGIFVAGTVIEPKDIPESVIDGSSAAACASAYLSEVRGELIKEKQYPPELDVEDEDLRIGVFVCRCGRNIASVVDVPSVVKYAAQLPAVVYANEFIYSCSQDSLEQLKKEIVQKQLNRVVVASCTPRTHEELFRDTVREVGLNRYLFDMASIREQVSWVHMQKTNEATEKAKELVAMMVERVRNAYPIKQTSYEVIKKCLVVGAGCAGIAAALHIADSGYEVFLVEKSPKLGGNLNQIRETVAGEKTGPFLEDLIAKVTAHKRIHLFKEAEVKEVSGFLGNFKTKIEVQGKLEEVEHGAIIIATGAEEYKPKEFAYGKNPQIITQRDLEERLSEPSTCTQGLGEEKGLTQPQSFVMLLCVGSRNEEHPYCSRFCCTQAIKNALRLKNISPQHKVIVLYRDIRTYGFMERVYLEAREKGVLFCRYDKDSPPEVMVEPDRKLKVSFIDTVLGEKLKLDCDWLILSTGVVPSSDNEKLAKLFKVPLNQDGFFMEAHAKIRPVDFSTEGVFFCGLAHSPQFIHDSLAQAQAAASRAICILSQRKIMSKGIVVKVNERLCRGCGICVMACPYGAREIDKEKNVAVVHQIVCQGCGACAVACPSAATEHQGFSKKQIMGMVEEAT